MGYGRYFNGNLGFISVDAARGMIENIDANVGAKVAFVKFLQADVESLIDKASDETLKKDLKALAEAVRYSDPMSSPQLTGLESDIGGKVASLSETLSDTKAATAMVNELQQMIADRNRRCKILK